MQKVFTVHVTLPPPNYLANKITLNLKFFLFFKDYISALDGTHIPAHVRSLY
jgi:hypothetical protein